MSYLDPDDIRRLQLERKLRNSANNTRRELTRIEGQVRTAPPVSVIKSSEAHTVDQFHLNAEERYFHTLGYQPSIIDRVTAPSSTNDDDRFLVIATATGDFAGQEDSIAVYDVEAGWQFLTPYEGLMVYVLDENLIYVYNGSAWDYNISKYLSIGRVGASTYYSVQHLQNIFHSAGWATGGGITDNVDGTVDIAAGTGLIRIANDTVSDIYYFDWSASASLALTDVTRNYVGVEYNSGSPQVVARTSNNFNYQTDFPLWEVYRSGTSLTITDMKHAIGDHATNMIRRLIEVNNLSYASGCVLSEAGTRYITVTAGVLWRGLTRFTTGAIDTDPVGAADTFTRYYTDGMGGWNTQTSQTQWDNTQYDASGTLTTMTNNWYAAQYFYLGTDGALVSIYGQAQYASLSAALAEDPPTDLPPQVVDHTLLIGRIVFQKSASSASEIDIYVGSASILPSGASDHGNQAGLSDNDHPQYLLVADIDDTPVDSETSAPISSNWAYDLLNATATFNALHRLWVSGGTANDVLWIRDTTDAADFLLRYDGTNFVFRNEASGAGNLIATFSPNSAAKTFHGDTTISSGGLHMDGSGTDDEALQVPYLTAAPATLVNGMIWMESDGLHIYYGGVEKIVAGV